MSKSHAILIERSRRGDQKAMMQLYDAYSQAMYHVACRYLNDEDAKDAMQDGFIKAFSKLDTFVPEQTFGTWLKRIIINQCIDQLKKKQLEIIETEVGRLELENDNDWQVDVGITKTQVLRAIKTLPLRYQVVVNLYLIEGFDHAEIATILKIPIKTSRTQLRRGRQKLQELLKPYYNEAGY